MTKEQIVRITNAEKVNFLLETMEKPLVGDLEKETLTRLRNLLRHA